MKIIHKRDRYFIRYEIREQVWGQVEEQVRDKISIKIWNPVGFLVKLLVWSKV